MFVKNSAELDKLFNDISLKQECTTCGLR